MAFDDDVDVINMSLGSVFGTADDASAVASTNVAKAGVIVVASAGNNGANQYITGAPGAGTGTISVAANDATASFPGATMLISTDGTITAINANGASFSNGTTLPVAVLRTSYPNGPVSLGCNNADYTNYPGGVSGKLVVTLRGVCSRVGRAIKAEQHGAAAAAMLNTDTGLPPFEGQITSDPDNGFQFTVTIPFFGVRGVLGPGATTDPDNLITADSPQGAGGTVTLTNATIPNTNFTGFGSFTSGGPRTGDSWLKPDVTAPGVSIFSTGNGSGNAAAVNSGTSMAAPHVAGVAALVKQAHPTWATGRGVESSDRQHGQSVGYRRLESVPDEPGRDRAGPAPSGRQYERDRPRRQGYLDAELRFLGAQRGLQPYEADQAPQQGRFTGDVQSHADQCRRVPSLHRARLERGGDSGGRRGDGQCHA